MLSAAAPIKAWAVKATMGTRGAPLLSSHARMARLADLAPLIGQKIEGAIAARIGTVRRAGPPVVAVAMTGTHLAASGASIARASLTGTVRDPAQNPDLALALAAEGVAAPGNVAGSTRLAASGRLGAAGHDRRGAERPTG